MTTLAIYENSYITINSTRDPTPLIPNFPSRKQQNSIYSVNSSLTSLYTFLIQKEFSVLNRCSTSNLISFPRYSHDNFIEKLFPGYNEHTDMNSNKLIFNYKVYIIIFIFVLFLMVITILLVPNFIKLL